MIYLGSPYTHKDPAVRKERVRLNASVLHNFVDEKHTIFSPLVHFDTCEQLTGLKMDETQIMRCCLEILELCSGLLVYKLPGWEMSKGLRAEMEHAVLKGIPIMYLDDLEKSV